MSSLTPTYPIPHPFDEEQPFFFNPPEDDQDLPLKEIPGSYGAPLIGAVLDRWDFYYNQGRDGFFSARQEKYKSTVFRANAPPGPFIAKDPKVVVLLDAVSFPILFDTTKVEKKNVFDGTYMPSVNFTGGYRVLSFLDPSEPKHNALKSYFFNVLASKHDNFIPVLRKSLTELFNNLESQLAKSKEVNFNPIEKISHETKFVAAPGGGSVIKVTTTFHTVGNATVDEAKAKEGKEKAAGLFKLVEGYLEANPSAYN